jgi:hypothetical protein
MARTNLRSAHLMSPQFFLRVAACLLPLSLTAAPLPKGYTLPEENVSPDRRLAVLEPDPEAAGDLSKRRNLLIEAGTGRVLATLAGAPGFERMNHGGTRISWSADGHGLLWIVEGKWGPRAITYAAIDDAGMVQQVNVLQAIHAELLAWLRKAKPRQYAAAVKQNRGNGSAYPEGFTVDVLIENDDSAELPVRFRAGLTSNPKGVEGFPPVAEVEAFLRGALNEKLALEWSDFRAFDKVAREREYGELEGAEEGLAHLEGAIRDTLSNEERERFEDECAAFSKAERERSEGPPGTFSFGGVLSAAESRTAIRQRVAELAKRFAGKIDPRDLPHAR